MKPVDCKNLSTEDIIAYYNPEVEKIGAYLPWLLKQRGAQNHSNYGGDGIEGSSITFPVYDSTLLTFVRVCESTGLIDRNYVYFYSRNRIKDAAGELAFIQRASIKDMGDMWSILSKYMIQGRTKGPVWSEGVTNGVYVALIEKMKELIVFWSGRIEQQ